MPTDFATECAFVVRHARFRRIDNTAGWTVVIDDGTGHEMEFRGSLESVIKRAAAALRRKP